MNDLTDTEKMTLLKRLLKLRFPLPSLLLMMLAVIEPATAYRVFASYVKRA